ncbi:DUF2397 family protein [Streptomyces sp. HB2AG]|uniref:DUF2397 family protein n=1 Tax=Streptomyces sp. HB2AG TaxID=2983400 RepID=UPI0022AAF271|nr:DUF2397 family protein [Streptomyces sp. HB2AG]MCZ2525576.1 DUF2397 family protein [Streptomyces sp. HB2AG]
MDQGTGRSADRRTGDSSEAEPRAAAADGRPAPYAYLGAPEPERTDHLAVLRVFRAAAPLAGLSASEVSERLGGRPGPAAVEARAQQLALWGNLLRVPQDTSSPDVPRYRLTALGERVQREAEAVLDAPAPPALPAVDTSLLALVAQSLADLADPAGPDGPDGSASASGTGGDGSAPGRAGRAAAALVSLGFREFAAALREFCARLGELTAAPHSGAGRTEERADAGVDAGASGLEEAADRAEEVAGALELHVPAMAALLGAPDGTGAPVTGTLPAELGEWCAPGGEAERIRQAVAAAAKTLRTATGPGLGPGSGPATAEEPSPEPAPSGKAPSDEAVPVEALPGEDPSGEPLPVETSPGEALSGASSQEGSSCGTGASGASPSGAPSPEAASRRGGLLRLARWFDAADAADAHDLFDAAFGLHRARHLGIALAPGTAVPAGTSWWAGPTVRVPAALRECGSRATPGQAPAEPVTAATVTAATVEAGAADAAASRAAEALAAGARDAGFRGAGHRGAGPRAEPFVPGPVRPAPAGPVPAGPAPSGPLPFVPAPAGPVHVPPAHPAADVRRAAADELRSAAGRLEAAVLSPQAVELLLQLLSAALANAGPGTAGAVAADAALGLRLHVECRLGTRTVLRSTRGDLHLDDLVLALGAYDAAAHHLLPEGVR